MCFQIQNKQRELDALKNRNEALLLQMKEAQERYKKEEEELQVKPRPLQCRENMSHWQPKSHTKYVLLLKSILFHSKVSIICAHQNIDGHCRSSSYIFSTVL